MKREWVLKNLRYDEIKSIYENKNTEKTSFSINQGVKYSLVSEVEEGSMEDSKAKVKC